MDHTITSKTLRQLARQVNPESNHKITKFAILGNRSTQFLSKFIQQSAKIQGIHAEIYESDYNQVEAEILNPHSALYQFQPQFVFVVHSLGKLRGDFYDLSLENKNDFNQSFLAQREMLCQTLLNHLSAHIILTNFELSFDGVFGNFANKTRAAFPNQLRRINTGLMDLAEKISQVHILDIAAMGSQLGLSALQNPELYINADIPYATDSEAKIAWEFVSIVSVIQGKFKKCLIMDLDNTLWGGIIGDDGMAGIQIGNLGIGKAFTEIQKWAKQLKERGIILAICSKNQEDIAKEPFERHPEMVLKLDDIAVFVANWSNKADNIRYIQSVLNIGFDSMVFLDDNPAERALVRENLPEIEVPELPEDPAYYLPYLSSLNLFETNSFSGEDKIRNKQYQEEAKRKSTEETFIDMNDFLKSLNMQGEIRPFQEINVPRIAQLSQRSNQFNLRTVRYSETDILRIKGSSDYLHYEVSLNDKFGQYGLISLVILEKKNASTLFIDTWIMSCRVLKRRVENYVLNHLVEEARKLGFNRIWGEYLPTEKNEIVKDFYSELGFSLLENGVWELEVDGFDSIDHWIGE